MYETQYSYFINPATKKFLQTNEAHSPITTPPSFYFGDRPKFTLSFPADTIAEGDTLIAVLDNENRFLDTKQATGLNPVMAGVLHEVNSDEADAQSLEIQLFDYSKKFADVINGHDNAVTCLFTVYMKSTDGEGNFTLVELGQTIANGEPTVTSPECVWDDLPVTKYYTREELDAIYNQFLSGLAAMVTYSNLAKSYAVGGTGTREGEDTDNAKHYCELAGNALVAVQELQRSVNTLAAQAHTDASNIEQYKNQIVAASQNVGSLAAQVSNDAQKVAADKRSVSQDRQSVEQMKQSVETANGNVNAKAQEVAQNARQVASDKTAAAGFASRSENANTQAQQAKTDAQGFAGNAQTSANQAEEFKNQTSQLAANAQTSATNAHNSEVGARNHEKSAEEKAAETAALYESIKALIAHIYVAPAYGYGVTKDNNVLSFTWCDPADNDVVKWLCSRLIFKRGGFPENENDGEVLVDNYIHNAYKTHPFVYDMGSTSDYYFAIFTQSTGGIWNTGSDAPRFTTADLTWATIGMMSRAGTLLQYPQMQIGSVVDIKVNELYPLLRYKLVHVDYKGAFENINDFMYDNTLRHNSIWIPEYLPCYGEDNMSADMAVFDQQELEYGETWDTLFLAGRAYYTVSRETYTQLSEGTDYEDGTSVAEWVATHGTQVYNKNNASRVQNGNNIWKESNKRQQLNARGTNWFVKQNPFDVAPGSTTYKTGWLTGFDAGFLAQVMPVYNKTARNTVSALTFGGGGGYDITLDTFWLPSIKEVFNTNVNNIAEGYQFDYFKNVATTNADRIQRDNGGTARYVFLRSCSASNVYNECFINTSGASNTTNASYSIAFLPAMCVA